MKTHRAALVWFRRDLRLADHPALAYALEHSEHVVPLFVWDPEDDAAWTPGAASRWWLHHSLHALDAALRSRGARLIVRLGDAATVVPNVLREAHATLLTWDRLYEPEEIAREKDIQATAASLGVETHSTMSSLWCDPATLRNQQGRPYRVFGAFWRTVERELDGVRPPLRAPRCVLPVAARLRSEPIEALQLLPRIRWYEGIQEFWTPGEAGALRQLKRFAAAVHHYKIGRERPDRDHTARLSPHLHFGEITPMQVLAALRAHGAGARASASATGFLRELGWREFAQHLLFHFPETTDRCLDPRFERMQWSEGGELAERWRRGVTGVPLIDAGMRQLWRTGWMHNRVRMIVASFLTKHLRTHWLAGARWFWETLVDADLANNTLNWQWVAGCGADAAPYYRIFNPVLQAERFDPERRYIRAWVPEIAALPDRWIHAPWTTPANVLAQAGVVLGRDYPWPAVDLEASRKAALSAYARLQGA